VIPTKTTTTFLLFRTGTDSLQGIAHDSDARKRMAKAHEITHGKKPDIFVKIGDKIHKMGEV
jgi:hypothetical protein